VFRPQGIHIPGSDSDSDDGDDAAGAYEAARRKPAAAATSKAALSRRRMWQPPPLVANLQPPVKNSPVLVGVVVWCVLRCAVLC
jgi:hypothetical protein